MIVKVHHIEIDTQRIEALAKLDASAREKSEVRTACEFLNYRIPEDDPQREYLVEIRATVKRLYKDALAQPDEQNVEL